MKLARRQPAERRLLLCALVVVAVATGALRLVSSAGLPRLLGRVARVTAHGWGRPSIEALAWAVAVTSRYVPGATCLPRALALQALLERAGHAARVRVELVRSADGELGGHAWVETADVASVAGRERGAYSSLVVLDPDGGTRPVGPEGPWRRASR